MGTLLTLAWANLTHHRLRAVLSALAVGIGIMLLLVSRGLARGSIAEVGQRMQSVDAELIVLPSQDNIIFTNGAPFRSVHERYLRRMTDDRGPVFAAVVPAFFGQVRMGGQQQRLFGVDPAQMDLFLGQRRVLQGVLFDKAHAFAARIRDGATPPSNSEAAAYAEWLADGLELVIDERLRAVGDYQIGDEIRIMGRLFRIVGVVEAGVAGRVFAPLQTLREIVVAGQPSASMYFLKLNDRRDPVAVAERVQAELGTAVRVELKSDYGRLLRESFASVNLYMNASSGVALVACFLFILLTMYTMVLQQTREIGVLKALGVTRAGLLGLAVIEALLIALGGVAVGILLALGCRAVIYAVAPLLTVDLAVGGIILAVVIGVVGGTLSALYPGYRAAALDPARALGNE
jgi:ABC-type antimicrobial peptide transport system permease subunit